MLNQELDLLIKALPYDEPLPTDYSLFINNLIEQSLDAGADIATLARAMFILGRAYERHKIKLGG